MMVDLARLILPDSSSACPFVIPMNLKFARRGLSCTCISRSIKLPWRAEMNTCTLENKRWRQRLVIALENDSPPGSITLSPACKPEIDRTIVESRVLIPVTLIERTVYSLGILLALMFSRSGSIEVTLVVSVSCAKEAAPSTTNTKAKKADKYLCMLYSSIYKAVGQAVWRGKLGVKIKWDC